MIDLEKLKQLTKQGEQQYETSANTENYPEFVWVPEFISLGGSVLYDRNGREPNDIDIIVRADVTPDGRLFIYLDPALRLKIERILREKYGDLPVEWVPSRYGPNWRYKPLYHLVLKPADGEVVRLEELEPEFAQQFYKAFEHEGIEFDIEHAKDRWRELIADLRYIANSGYPRLKEGKVWGKWTLDDVKRYFARIVDTLRGLYFPIMPPPKGDKRWQTSYWQLYREAEPYMKTKPPKDKDELKEWNAKRRALLSQRREAKKTHPEDYNPKEFDDDRLLQDMRMFTKWWHKEKHGDTVFTPEEIIEFGRKCLNEIVNRNLPLKIEPEDHEYYRELLKPIKAGLYLVAPHAELIYRGNKSAIVKSRRYDKMTSFLILCDNDTAYGYIRCAEPQAIGLEEFKKLQDKHKVSEDERQTWWPNADELYYYEILNFIPFESPRPVKIPKGVQTFIPEVEFIKSRILWKSEEKQQFIVVVYEPYVRDAQGDWTTPEEIEKMADQFALKGFPFYIEHSTPSDIKVLWNWCTPIDFTWNGQFIRKGSWLIKAWVPDKQLWDEIKKGEFTGVSIRGYAKTVSDEEAR